MGKKHKKSIQDLPLAAEKQKEKIRRSILEVFRGRLKSSDGGGGILVANDNQASGTTAAPNISADADADDSSSSMNGQEEKHQQRKKKRTRKQRNRNNSTSRVETENKSDVGKQVKTLCGASYSLRSSGICVTDRKVSMISQSRLTRKLGLFNQGKKSDKIERADGIFVPEGVRKQTEEDMRIILRHTGSERQPVTVDLASHSPVGYMQDKCHGRVSARSSTSVTPASPRHKAKSVISSTTYTGGSVSSVDTEEVNSIPESPHYEEIADLLLSSLKTKDLFPGRNLLHETTSSLYKLLKQNGPRSATPTPSSAKILSSDSVKRSLLDRFPPTTETATEAKEEKHIIHHTPPQSPDPGNTANRFLSLTENPPQPSSLPSDARGLLEHNDKLITATAISSSQPEPMETDSCVSDARSLLLHNDTVLAGKYKQNFGHNYDSKENYAVDMTQLQTAAKYCSISRDSGSQHSTHSSRSSGYSHSQHTVHSASSLIQSNQAVIAEYMPQFHGGYYKDSLKPEEFTCCSNRTTHSSQGDSMDILEYLDGGDHKMQHLRNRTLLKAATPDSDGSPVWMAPEPIPLLRKPPLDTPSPPDTMYPRRLY